ncbi:MAG: hypothetical protein V4664_01505 [Patescibacteria group bacterium]
MEIILEGTQEEDSVEDRVFKVRENLQVYNGIQSKLIKRKHSHLSHGPIGKAMEWVDTYSPEYEAAFKDLVRDKVVHNESFLDEFTGHPEETISQIESRVEQYHILELRLMKHIDPYGKIPKNFSEWHSQFGKPLMRLLYSQPKLFEKYLDSQDEVPEIQEGVLKDLEDLLYGQ